MAVKALFFDQDGVIIDTERDGHRVAFNKTFREFGFDFEWSVEEYHELLQVGGGKERMRHYLNTKGFGIEINPDTTDQLILDLHKRKTDIFISMLEEGELPLRPGVYRLMKEAQDNDILIGVCTTSNERSAKAITGNILKGIHFSFVLAGDVVNKKKPDPEIYLMALEKTGFGPKECIVVEDSNIGARAAKAARMNVVVTVNPYTENEDVSMGDIVVTSLGDETREASILKNGPGLKFNGLITIPWLLKSFSDI